MEAYDGGKFAHRSTTMWVPPAVITHNDIKMYYDYN